MLHPHLVLVKMPLHVSNGNHYRLYFENASSTIQMFMSKNSIRNRDDSVARNIFHIDFNNAEEKEMPIYLRKDLNKGKTQKIIGIF